MGQSAIGVMYGCRLPEGVDWFGSDPELMLDFHTVIGWHYDSNFRPISIEGEDDVPILGVLVAVSGSGENGAADLWPSRRFADIALLPEMTKARETWERFVAWGRERQIELPEADLWIVTTETA